MNVFAGGTARVAIRVKGEPEMVWPALVDPARLAGWFGAVDEDWPRPGGGRVHFGDTDFFEVDGRSTDAGRLVEFDWRYLGVAPPARVRWSLAAVTGGTEITVEDRDPSRGPADTAQRAAEWTDLLDRLACLLST